MSQLLKTVEQVREQLNPGLTIHGIVLTMYDARNNLSGQVVADVREFMGPKVYDTIIPRNVRVSEAPSYGKPVLVYDLKCSGSEAYLRLATEIIQREKELCAADVRANVSSQQSPVAATATGDLRPGVRMTESSGETAMAEEGDPVAIGTRTGRVDRRCRRRKLGRSGHAASGGCRPVRCGPMRAIRDARLPRPSSTNWPPRCASAASSSRSWCARCAARRTATRSSPASGAGGRRSAPDCTRCRSSSSKRPTPKRLQLAIIENVQRADLNPLEEAEGYRALMDEFDNSQDDIAKIVGKSRSHVANTLRLLKLSDPVKAYIHDGKLTAGHARMLVGQPNAERWPRRSSRAGSMCARSRRWRASAQRRRHQTNKVVRIQRRTKLPTRLALEKRLSDALGLSSASISGAAAARSPSATAISTSSTISSGGSSAGSKSTKSTDRPVYRRCSRARSIRSIKWLMTGLMENGMKRTGAQNVICSPKTVGFRSDSVARGGLMNGE